MFCGTFCGMYMLGWLALWDCTGSMEERDCGDTVQDIDTDGCGLGPDGRPVTGRGGIIGALWFPH